MKKVLIGICIILLCACQYVNSVSDSYIKNYLKKSYGEEKEFIFSEEGNCDLYQLGYCSKYYKASDVKDDVYVVWYDGDGMDIRDDYLFKKYKNDIRDYYYNYRRIGLIGRTWPEPAHRCGGRKSANSRGGQRWRARGRPTEKPPR